MLALFVCWQANAQVNAYTFSSAVATYTPITGGTVVASGNAIDEEEVNIALPSSFTFNNQPYSSVAMSADGRLYLGDFESGTTPTGVIIALGFNLVASAPTAEMRWQQIGDEMIFQWKDMKRKITSPVNTERLNFQARLNLATNKVLMVYGDFTNVSTTTTYANYPKVGLRGDDTDDYFYRRLTATVPDDSPSWDDTSYAVSSDQNLRLTSASPETFPESGLTYSWVAPTNVIDLSISRFPLEQNSYCPVTGVPLKVTIMNTSAFPLDLSLHPALVEVTVTGASSQTFSQVINSGMLDRDQELEVILSDGANFTEIGQHSITAKVTVTGDINTSGNQTATSFTIRPILPNPFTESFDFTDFPENWFIYSGWEITPEHGKTTNGLSKQFNNNGSSFQLPTVGTIGDSDFLEFDFRVVNTAGYPAFPASTYWGELTVSVSTDCGRTFTDIAEISPDNYNATTAWTRKSYPLAAYAGQNIMVLISNRWIVGDYFIDFDNFSIKSSGAPPPTLCAAVTTPANGAQNIMTGDVTLNWTPAADGSAATSYDVYFGISSSNPAFIGNTTQTNRVVQANIPGTVYYWKVIAKSAEGGSATDCQTWSFITCEGTIWYQDSDHDTHGNPSVSFLSCQQPLGYVGNANDCDDTNANLFQSFAFYTDHDGDGFGTGSSQNVCALNAQTPPAGYALNDTDCDDNNALKNTTFPFYIDADGDGFGTGTTVLVCSADANTPPFGYSNNNTDCDDTNVSKNRTFPFYADTDGDGYGAGTAILICNANGTAAPVGYSVNNTDCDDNNASIYRSAALFTDADGDTYTTTQTTVICYGATIPAGYRLVAKGNDCDDQNPLLYRSALMYVDADHDNYSVGPGEVKCYGTSLPAGYSLTSNGEDCNDSNASQHGLFPFYTDNDNDGYGTGTLVSVCAASAFIAPDGYSLSSNDCDDTNATIHQRYPFYVDADGDGYGTGTAVLTCAVNPTTPPAGYAANATDCNDNDATVYRSGSVYIDADNDTYTAGSVTICYGDLPPAGYRATPNGFDCNDNDASVYRFATLYHDADGDGYTTGSAGTNCIGAQAPAGYSLTTNGIDCDDTNASVYRTVAVYADADNDGYTIGNQTNICAGATIPLGFTLTSLGVDCDDTNAAIYRTVAVYVDTDNDGYTIGNQTNICAGATIPSGFALTSLGMDCNDNNAAINPSAAEIPNDGIDNNCNGQTDEGTAGITTQLLNTACGATLATINSLIGINTSYPGTLATTAYRIRLTNGAQVQTIEKNVPHFSLMQFPTYDYATTYSVAIELQQNGVWLGYYGPSCLISSPAIIAVGGSGAVIPSQCGSQLPSINTLIATTSLPGVSGYRFRVTNLTDPTGPNAVQVIDRSLHWFSLQMLQRYNYGTTYKIEVAVKTTGAFGLFGQPCEVASPSVPALTNCGATIPKNTTPIAANSANGVTQYRFMVTRISDGASVTLDRTTNFFILNSLQNLLADGASYSVRVAVMTAGNWSPFGAVCGIVAPGGSITTVVPGSVAKAIDVVAHPNPFVNDFNLSVRADANQNALVNVYDLWGRLLESAMIEMAGTNEVKLGSRYPAGVYQIVISQGETVKTLHVIKR